jgi:hypothetical protein
MEDDLIFFVNVRFPQISLLEGTVNIFKWNMNKKLDYASLNMLSLTEISYNIGN